MKKGFTLIELLIVVIVIAILATFAIPQYLTAVERAKEAKARHNLSVIMQAEKMCRAVNDSYVAIDDTPHGNNCTSATDTLGTYVEMLDIDSDPDWTYSSSNVTASTITLTAARAAGPNNADRVTLTESGIWAGNFTPQAGD